MNIAINWILAFIVSEKGQHLHDIILMGIVCCQTDPLMMATYRFEIILSTDHATFYFL